MKVRRAPWHDVDGFYDSTGIYVYIGERVAYNLSGSIAIGKVLRVRVQAWKEPRRAILNPSSKVRVTIEYEEGRMGVVPKHESVITDSNCAAKLDRRQS